MKHLTLIRHAKSSHDDPTTRDFYRPLSPRGWDDARAMAAHLDTVMRFQPDLILTSPAVRALNTARVIGEAVGISEWSMQKEERIYEAPINQLLDVLREVDDEVNHVAMFGHNPGIENFTNWLCGSRVVESVVTCAVITLEVQITSWSRLNAGKGQLLDYIYPKLIGAGKADD